MKTLVVFAIIIILALAGIGYFVSEYGGFGGMKIYTSDTYGISFSYPKKYFLTEKLQPGSAERYHYVISLFEDTEFNRKLVAGEVLGTEGPVSISFDIYQNNLDKLTLLGWLNTGNSNFKLGDGKHELTKVNGKEAVKYSWDGLYQGDTVAWLSGDNLIAGSVTYNSSDDVIRQDFEKILETVKLK